MPETGAGDGCGGAGADAGESASVLVADDDAAFRALLGTLLRETSGVSVLVAADGIEALQVGLQLRPQVVVLDLQMPRLDGVEVAITLRDMRPSLPIALQSADPHALHARASGLGLPLFDKLDLNDLLAWAEKQIRSWSVHATTSAARGSGAVDGVLASADPRTFAPS
jgi:CheY-like chemotaxis protein